MRAPPRSQSWQVLARRYVNAIFFPHSYQWGAEAHSPRHLFLQVRCRDLAPGQYPPHLRLRSTACFRPFSAQFSPSRHNAYTARLPHYIGPSSTSQYRRRHSLLYPAIVPPLFLQCHPACHAPPRLSFIGSASARARLLTRLVSHRSDSQRCPGILPKQTQARPRNWKCPRL